MNFASPDHRPAGGRQPLGIELATTSRGRPYFVRLTVTFVALAALAAIAGIKRSSRSHNWVVAAARAHLPP
jgi:hypothetical protein